MIVFRVELRYTPVKALDMLGQLLDSIPNIGPYQRKRYNKETGFKHHSLSWYAMDTMPGPKEENLHFNPGEHVFGFVSLDQLRVWWKRDHEDLQDAGFYVAQYKVDRRCVSVSPTQCAFKIKKAKLIGWQELDQVFQEA